MERHVNGFVIGKDSVRGEPTWKVRVQDDRSTRNGKKLKVASVLPGVTLAKAMDVSFDITDQLIAVNTAPRGVIKEGNPDMQNKTIAIIALLFLIALGLVGGLFTMNQPLTPEEQRSRVASLATKAVKKLKVLTAEKLIDDKTVRAAIRGAAGAERFSWADLRSTSWAVREAVFEKHQCWIFSKAQYTAPLDVCDTARYSEGATEGNWWYENSNIPVSIAPAIVEMRQLIYAVGREHLRQPQNLHAVYQAKRSVALDEYNKLSVPQQAAFQKLLTSAIATFERFRDDKEARAEYHEYLRLYDLWLNADCCKEFSAWQDQEKVLQNLVVNLDLYLFAGRRFSEGGVELLNAYIEVMDDLRSNLNG